MNQYPPSYPSTPSLSANGGYARHSVFAPARSSPSTPLIPLRHPYGSHTLDSSGHGYQPQARGLHHDSVHGALPADDIDDEVMSLEAICAELQGIERQILELRRVYIDCVARLVEYVKSLASLRFFAVDQQNNCSDSALFTVRASNLYTLIHAVEPQTKSASTHDSTPQTQNVSTDALAVRFYPLLVEHDPATRHDASAAHRLSFTLVPQEGCILALPNASPHSPSHEGGGTTSPRTPTTTYMCMSALCVHMRTMVQRNGSMVPSHGMCTGGYAPGSSSIKLLHRTPKQLVSAQVVMDERLLTRQTLHSISQLVKSNTSGVGVELACIGSFTRGGRQRPLVVLQRIRFSVEHLVTRDDPPIWPLSVAQSLFDDEHELCVTLRNTLVTYDRLAHRKRALVILQASAPTGAVGFVDDGVADAAPAGSVDETHSGVGTVSPIFSGSSVSLHPNAASISAGLDHGVVPASAKLSLATQQALLRRGREFDDRGPEMSCAVM